MNVDDIVAAKIAAARRKIAATKKDRAAFAAARSHGLARRHAAKLRHLAERRAAATDSVSATDEQPPLTVSAVHTAVQHPADPPPNAAQRPTATTPPEERG